MSEGSEGCERRGAKGGWVGGRRNTHSYLFHVLYKTYVYNWNVSSGWCVSVCDHMYASVGT